MKRTLTRTAAILTLIAAAATFAGTSRGDGAEADAVKEILGHQRDWANALVNNDRRAVDAILADDFAATDSTGHLWSRGAILDAVASGLAGIASIESSDWKVRVYAGSAVVTGRNAVATRIGRADYAGNYRVTNTYVRQDGRWRCVSAHEGRIAE
jgi:ketosteroid isomerase-like protein